MNSILTSTLFRRSSWFVRGIQILCLILVSGPISTPAWSCGGADYQETLQILYESLLAGYNMGLTGDYSRYTPILQDLGNRAQALPPSCQSLLNQWSRNFANRYDPNAVRCVGDVCCDGGGCVGN